ncbi:MAG: hypothetical protein EU547_06990 [Promethearchaeota archaeon]|nr:MAG: hypothetical protein EU547_06990 [Candidatus Lokiarchaeota archaeon]
MLYNNILFQVSGISAFLSLCIGFVTGSIVLYRAIKTKDRLVFSFFLAVIFTLSPWYPSGFGYLIWLITQGGFLDQSFYILIGTVAIPIAIIAWLDIYMATIRPDKRILVLLIYSGLSIVFEIYLFYFLFFAPNAPIFELLGIISMGINPLDIDYKGFLLIFQAIVVISACATGIHFSYTSIKIEEKPVVWKGRFLFLAFTFFGIAAISDAMIDLGPIFIIVVRIILILANFFFYTGFLLPKWIRKLLNLPLPQT